MPPVARREAAAHLRQVYAVSERRACKAISADRSSVRYRSRRPDDGAVRVRLQVLLRRERIAITASSSRATLAPGRALSVAGRP